MSAPGPAGASVRRPPPRADVQDVAARLRNLDNDGLLALVGMLIGEVADLRLEEMTRAELRRRCGLLAARAEEDKYGRVRCPVCGKPKPAYYLAEHLRRRHAEAIADLPPAEFNLAKRTAG